MKADIENAIITVPHALNFSKHNPKDKLIPRELLGKPWEVHGTNVFTINNKFPLYHRFYFGKLSIVKLRETFC